MTKVCTCYIDETESLGRKFIHKCGYCKGKDTRIAELECELGEAKIRYNGTFVQELMDKCAGLEAQLAPGPCGKHPMWAWRCKNCGAPESAHLRKMPEPPTNEFVGHCILCEEVQSEAAAKFVAMVDVECAHIWEAAHKHYAGVVQAAEAAALERAAAIADEVATKHYRKAETSEGDVAEVIHNRIIDLMPLTPSSAGAQATSNSVTTPPVIAMPISEDYLRGYADGRLNTMTVNEGKVRRDDSDSTPAPVPASGGSPLVSERETRLRALAKEWRTEKWLDDHMAELDADMLFIPRHACADELERALLDQAQDHE